MKEIRFRRPEYQNKLRRARRFERRNEPLVRESLIKRFIAALGFRSRFGRSAAVFLCLLVIYFLAISRIFVVGSSANSDAAATLARLQDERVYLIPKSHILLLTRLRLLAELQSDNPQVRRITHFKKNFPNTLEVALEMREPTYVWQTGEKFFLTDQDGVIFAPLAAYEDGTTTQPLIIDRGASPVATGQDVADPRLVPFVNELRQLWPQLVRDINYESFSIPAISSPDLFVKTETGFQVYFDLTRPVHAQLKNLNLVLTREVNPATYSGLSYIDLRIPAFAYYCYVDALCAPEYKLQEPK